MALKLYNTLTRQDEEFTPLDPEGKFVSFYSCGPTVYDYAHIGNFRSFLNADLLRRTLELLGYDVIHVMNITDVGHMTDDTDADGGGEDKMEAASKRLLEAKKSGALPEGVQVDPNDPMAIAEFYSEAFMEDARTLGLRIAHDVDEHPERMPRPTNYIPQMISMVESLVARGHAYVAEDGVVYFDVRSYPQYGALSGNTIDSLKEGLGGRIQSEHQQVKKDPADFMLWKPDPKHLMRWASPWGEGYPGWHLECSVMAESLLGDLVPGEKGMIDLHSGGEDNIFPHHECEIAQSCCSTGQPQFARHWFHTRHLIVEGQKMSKSKGNFFTVRDLLSRGATPAAIRLELTRTHYRVNANFTFQGLKDAQRQIDRWIKMKTHLQENIDSSLDVDGPGPLQRGLDEFIEALGNDLNIAGAIGSLNEAVSAARGLTVIPADAGKATCRAELDALMKMDSVLGVMDLEQDAGSNEEDGGIDDLINQRLEARQRKDFQEADRIRDDLLQMGIEIKDGPEGTTWRRVVS